MHSAAAASVCSAWQSRANSSLFKKQ
jgi:hypothetical protein